MPTPNATGRATSRGAVRRTSSRSAGSRSRPNSPRRAANRRSAILHHHHRPVHDQPEIHRPQAQQAGGNARLQHEVRREQHGERDHDRHDQAGAEVPRKTNSTATTSNAPASRLCSTVRMTASDQLGPVVEHLQLHVRGQKGPHLGQLRRQRMRDHLALFSPISMKPSPSTASPRPSAVTAPRRISWSSLTVRHVPHAHRRPVVAGDDDVPDLLDVRGQPDPVQEQRLPAPHDLPAPRTFPLFAWSASTRSSNVRPVLHQPVGLHHDVVLLLEPAPGVHLRHPGTFRSSGLTTQSCRTRNSVSVRFVSVERSDVMENLPQPGGTSAPSCGRGNPLGQVHPCNRSESAAAPGRCRSDRRTSPPPARARTSRSSARSAAPAARRSPVRPAG
jgi:hypothetical protein